MGQNTSFTSSHSSDNGDAFDDDMLSYGSYSGSGSRSGSSLEIVSGSELELEFGSGSGLSESGYDSESESGSEPGSISVSDIVSESSLDPGSGSSPGSSLESDLSEVAADLQRHIFSNVSNDKDDCKSHTSSLRCSDTNISETKIEAQAPCIQATKPPEVIKIGLEEQSEDELQHRLLDMNITREDILSITQIQKINGNENGHYDRFDIFNGKDDIRTRVNLAVHLLDISPQLSILRLKMVPAKVSERKFWVAVFCLLEEGRPDLNKSLDENKSENGDKPVIGLLNLPTNNSQEENSEITQLREKLSLAHEEIEKMKLEMLNFRKVKVNGCTLATPAKNGENTSAKIKHRGKWIIDKESEEFLSLDDDIKKQLREGKQKRLREVMEQMKFILDTDNLSSTYGRWDCCGKTTYNTCECS